MKTALVMGGTTFCGKCLVRHLGAEGYDVTVATRGQTKDSLGDGITRVRFERTNLASMEEAFAGKRYDIVFDQIGYCADDMADACKVFAGKIGHYVFTSSIIVYCDKPDLGKVEGDFDPATVSCSRGRYPDEIDYMEGKMEAEAYLAENATFGFAAARLPMVMGLGDPTGRLEFIVRHILDEKALVIPPDSGLRNFVEVDDAGRFLAWLGTTAQVGAYNAGSDRWIGPVEMTKIAGEVLGIEPVILDEGPECDRSEYAGSEDMTTDVGKAEGEGYEFAPFDQWYRRVVEETALDIKKL